MSTSRIRPGAQPAPTMTPLNPTAAAKNQAVKGVAAPEGAAVPTPTEAGADGQTYDVQISPQAKAKADEYQKALGIAKRTPDIRSDKVDAIKKQLAAGTYEVDPGRIADGIAREALRDHVAETDR